MSTLHKKYLTNKISKLQTKAVIVDSKLINENKACNLILEAMDEGDLSKASDVIQKLKNVAAGMPTAKNLQSAVKAAIADVNKYTGGNAITKMGQELFSKLTGSENPIVKALALAQCLEKGFSLMPQIIKNLGLDDGEGDTLVDRIESKSKKENDSTQKSFKLLQSNLTKAYTPSGIFGAFKKVPYADIAAIVNELMTTVNVKEIQQGINTSKQGPQASELEKNIKDSMKSGAAVKGTQSSTSQKATRAAKGTNSSDATVATTGTVASNEKVTKPAISDGSVKVVASDAARKLNIDYEDAERMIRYLRKIGKLQEAIDTGVLTLTVNREKLSKLIKLVTIAPSDNIVSTHLCECMSAASLQIAISLLIVPKSTSAFIFLRAMSIACDDFTKSLLSGSLMIT